MKKLAIFLIIIFALSQPMVTLAEIIADYREYVSPINKPSTKFSITLSNGESTTCYTGKTLGAPVELKAKVGDTMILNDQSTSNAGYSLLQWDLQVYGIDNGVSFLKDISLYNSSSSLETKYRNYKFTRKGTYNFFLCVKDSAPLSKTGGWANWSENGNHMTTKLTEGPDGIEGTADDKTFYWYFTQIRVVVTEAKPVADFQILYNGSNATDNKDVPIKRSGNTLQVTLKDKSTVTGGTITKRVWRFYNTNTWSELPNQGTNDITLDVDSSAINASPNKIIFQLGAYSNTGEVDWEEHTVYSVLASTKIIVHHKSTGGTTLAPDDIINTETGLPTKVYSKAITGYLANKTSDTVTVPDGVTQYEYTFTYSVNNAAGKIIVHHKDAEGNTVAEDDTFLVALDSPTEVFSKIVPNHTPSKASDMVTVPAADSDKQVEYTFTYNKVVAASQVFALIDAPDFVVMGNDSYFSGARSYTTDPTDTINIYQWTFSKPFVIVSGFTQGPNGTAIGKEGVVYFTQPGECNVELTVTSNKGMDDDNDITIIDLPIPNTILLAADTKVNRKITSDASTSTSKSTKYPIDWTKTEWEISIEDGTKGLTLNDIKTLHTYTLGTNTAGKQVMQIKGDLKKIDVLSKKEGKINIQCTLYSTAGYSSFALRTVNIAPDLPPEAIYSYVKRSVRNPDDSNYSSFDIVDVSNIPDGDTIGKRVWLYCFDSDNDGNFKEEVWYVLDNGVWQPVTNYGIDGSYESLKDLNIDLINDGNQSSIVLKNNKVGTCEVHLIVREELNATNSIMEFITPADMLKESTL